MAIQSSGEIKMSDVHGEFGGTAPHGLKEYYDAASGVPSSGEISLKDFYGTSSIVAESGSAGQTNIDLSSVFGTVWGQATAKEYTIASGVEVGGTGNGTTQAAIRVPTGMSGTLTIVVAGTVTGYGGDGGSGGAGSSGWFGGNGEAGQNGQAGGHAIYIESNNVTVQVASGGTLRAGGGGGGGGGGGFRKRVFNNWRAGGTGGNGGNGAGYQQSLSNGSGGGGQYNEGGNGGNGGTFGTAGSDGQAGENGSSNGYAGGEGGAAGTARLHASGISSTLNNQGGTVQG